MSKGKPAFDLGERVRVWYRSAREWKVAIVRAAIYVPFQRSPDPTYYQVTCEGKKNPRWYRAEELQPLK